MKTTIETSSFTEAVAWATKNYDAKDDRAHVGFVMNADGSGYLVHLSETAYRKAPLRAVSVEMEDGKDSIALSLDGKYLQRLSSALGRNLGELEITASGDSVKSLNITSTFGDFTVPVYTYPLAKLPEVVTLGEVSETEFLDGMQRIAKLSDGDTSGSMPVLTAIDVRFHPEDKKVTMMGTDRFALGEMEFDYAPSTDTKADEILVVNDGESRSFLVPANIAATVAPEKGSSNNVAFVFDVDSEKVGYEFPDGRVALFSLIAGKPFKYAGMLDTSKESVEHSLIVNLNELKKAVGAVSSLAWDETHIWLKIQEGGKSITVADDHSKNTVETQIDVLETDEDLNVNFHRTTLGKAFNALSSAQIQFSWGGTSERRHIIVQPVIADGAVDESATILVQPQKS